MKTFVKAAVWSVVGLAGITGLARMTRADEGGSPDEQPSAVEQRLLNDAERAENGGDYDRAQEARDAAQAAGNGDVDSARQVERDYNDGTNDAGSSNDSSNDWSGGDCE